MLRGASRPIASHYLQPRSGGDMAAFRGIAKIVFARDAEAVVAGRPSLLDRAFLELASYDARFQVWGFSLFERGKDGVWRPQRDFPFVQPLPGPVAEP